MPTRRMHVIAPEDLGARGVVRSPGATGPRIRGGGSGTGNINYQCGNCDRILAADLARGPFPLTAAGDEGAIFECPACGALNLGPVIVA